MDLCANGFMNCTDVIGSSILNSIQYNTGSLFLTLLLIVIVVLAIALMLGLPLEFTSILVLPLLFITMSYNADVYAVGGVFMIYLAIILTKRFIIR